MKQKEFHSIFQPIKINQLVLNNRIIAAPTDVSVVEKATCKAGMIILGCGGVDDKGAWWDTPYMFSKYQAQKTRHTLDFLKQGGSRVCLELMHMGLYNRAKDGEYVIGPNDEINYEGTRVKALTKEELEELAGKFGQGAKDAKEFGFDMVMLHFAHGWLPAQFLSPVWNHRKDEFGGCYENRARFPLMILKAVRDAVGPDYPIDMRISAYEWVKDSISFEDTLHFLKDAQQYLDMVNISAGTDMDKQGCIHMAATSIDKHLINIHFSAEVKKQLSIPVAVVGSIMTPQEAEYVIREEKADMVMLGRALLADPKWIRKAMEGRSEDIVPCLRCLNCMHWATNRRHHSCSVNMRLLREDYVNDHIEKAKESRHAVIIGGGPAGMKAAITCAKRGHKVTLIEKEKQLGGMMNHSEYTDLKPDVKRYKDYLIRQVSQYDIDVHLQQTATRKYVESLHPDIVLCAIGAEPITLEIPGIEYAKQAVDVYPHLDEVKKHVVIIGGGSIGCELALELDKLGKHITIIEASDKLHRQGNLAYDLAMDEHLSKCQNLNIMMNAACTQIGDTCVIVKDALGELHTIACDTCILAVGMKAKAELVEEFRGIVYDMYLIGDCKRVGQIREANEDGFFISLNV